jgi:hypothetical protein
MSRLGSATTVVTILGTGKRNGVRVAQASTHGDIGKNQVRKEDKYGSGEGHTASFGDNTGDNQSEHAKAGVPDRTEEVPTNGEFQRDFVWTGPYTERKECVAENEVKSAVQRRGKLD